MFRVIYLLLIIIAAIILNTIEINFLSWQYWAIMGCMWGTNACGYIDAIRIKLKSF